MLRKLGERSILRSSIMSLALSLFRPASDNNITPPTIEPILTASGKANDFFSGSPPNIVVTVREVPSTNAAIAVPARPIVPPAVSRIPKPFWILLVLSKAFADRESAD